MALEFCIVASGSDGNAVWVRGNGSELLIDCGVSQRDLSRSLAGLGSHPDNVAGVVCTHHHGDHASGIPALTKRGVPVYASAATLLQLRGRVAKEHTRAIANRGCVSVGALRVQAVPTSHDAPGSIAVVVSDGICALGFATDLGCKTARLVKAFSNLDAVILESNHDDTMLRYGPYPPEVKRRILGPQGHLSNADAADLLAEIAHPGLQHVVLVHLSQENNTPEHAASAVSPVLASCAPRAVLAVDRRDSLVEPITLRGTGPLFASL